MDRSARLEVPLNALHANKRAATRPSDLISIERAAFLRSELVRQPEIRAEVVERARLLAKDPNYPPMEAVRKIAEQVLSAPDLSEEP